MLNGLSWWTPQTLRPCPAITKIFSKKIFNREECEHLKKLKNILEFQYAKFGNGTDAVKGELRSSQVAWLSGVKEKQIEWLYSRVGEEIIETNRQWNFNLIGFTEPFQYTKYHADELGKYDMHMDIGESTWFRKISVTIHLSHPDEYEGGELMVGDYPAPKEQGMMVCFPSFRDHCVKPITKGTRESLVIWVSGPAWQ